MDNKKVYISYTSEAEKAYEALTGDLKKRIEDFLIKEKYVTGDSEIEITVSDIERIKNRITIQSDPKKEKKFLLLGYTYIIIGVMVGSINSIFYFLHKAAEPFNCLEQDNLA